MSKRVLRSNSNANALKQQPLQPPQKRKKTEPVRYLCYSCDTERAASAFPDYNPSSDCDNHLINTCKNCLKQWVQTQIETNVFAIGGPDGKTFGVSCPQCPAIMRNVNIQIAATKKSYQVFEERERHHISETTLGWRWCLFPGCKAGQVHLSEAVAAPIKLEDNPPRKPKSKSKGKPKKKVKVKEELIQELEYVADICTCHECGAKACVTCDRPWHDGESCKEYQSRIQNRLDEEDKTLLEIQKVTRKCPSCSKNIQKNGGCSAMYCSECRTSFCWTCMSAFQRGYYCKCRPPPPPAQPPRL